MNRWTSASESYVRPRAQGDKDAWADEAARRGSCGTSDLRGVSEVPASAHIASLLEIEEGAPVVVRSRTVLLDGIPVELADSFYPADVAKATPLAEPRKIRGGAIAVLAKLGLAPQRVAEVVTARPPAEVECSILGISEGDWVLLLERVSYVNGRPVEVSVMVAPAAGRQMRYETEITREG